MLLEELVLWLLDGVRFGLELLPDDSIPWEDLQGYGDDIGAAVGWVDPLLPLDELARGLFVTANIVLPVAVTYRLVFWLYGKIPVIGS